MGEVVTCSKGVSLIAEVSNLCCHDLIRQCMEDAMDAAAELDKGRREELAAAKR